MSYEVCPLDARPHAVLRFVRTFSISRLQLRRERPGSHGLGRHGPGSKMLKLKLVMSFLALGTAVPEEPLVDFALF